MFAVSDTSPISNLAIIGRLDLARTRFEKIWIPASVEAELDRLPLENEVLRMAGE
jgi:predicted nucleic acid-binding protein